MKFLSFKKAGRESWGAVINEEVYDLGPSGAAIADTLKDAIRDSLLPADGAQLGRPSASIHDLELLPPITTPEKIICVGVNYREHREEAGQRQVEHPTIFTRFADTQVGHQADVLIPSECTQFDYEGELAVVIGASGRRVPEEDAMSLVAGYAPYNDYSVRDWQKHSGQWIPGKNFPKTGAFGPYFVPASDVTDVTALELETRVNGETRQSTKVSQLLFNIPELIAYITTFTALNPGDVIVTGTPGGVGLFMDPPALLGPGDVVEVEISQLGVLRNTVQAEK